MPDTAVTWEDAAPQSDVQWETPAPTEAPTQKSAIYSSGQGRGEQIQQVASDAAHAAKIAGGRIWENLKGLPQSFVPQTTTEKVGTTLMVPAPVTRMLSGILPAFTGEATAAVRDINASPNPGQVYSDALAGAAGDVGTAALLEGAGEVGPGIVKGAPAAVETGVRVAGKAARGAVEDIPVVRQVTKLGKYVDEAKTEVARRAQMKLNFASTPETVKPVMDEILNRGVEKPAAPAKAPETVGTQASADSDTAYFQQAKAKLGADAKISEVAKQAQVLKDQAGTFEKTFGQPLSNYMENGKFNMKDFLDEVVKPGTEPPAQVISKIFGGDGVELVRQITGEDIHKWAQAEPRAARVAREGARKPEPPPDTSVPGKRNGGSPDESFDPKQGDRMVKGADPKRYLNLSGADAGSVMKTQADIDTVNFWRERIRKGEPVPKSELRVNGEKSVLEADGRHRALAADLEGKKIDFIVRKRPLTGVRK